MIDYKQRVEDCGLKLSYIAEQMGMSRKTLWNKISGNGSFSKIEEEVFMMLTEPVNIKVVDPKGELFREMKDSYENLGMSTALLNLHPNVMTLGKEGEGRGEPWLTPKHIKALEALTCYGEKGSGNASKKEGSKKKENVWCEADMRIISTDLMLQFMRTMGVAIGQYIGEYCSKMHAWVDPALYARAFQDYVYLGVGEKYPELTKQYAECVKEESDEKNGWLPFAWKDLREFLEEE